MAIGDPSATEIEEVGGDDAYRDLLYKVRSLHSIVFLASYYVTIRLVYGVYCKLQGGFRGLHLLVHSSLILKIRRFDLYLLCSETSSEVYRAYL